MPHALINGKIEYRFFDKSFKGSSHCYVKKDVPELQRNCDAIINAMQGNGIAVMKQVHSTKVSYVDKSTIHGLEPEIDAIVTDKPGLILTAQTADCVPVLFTCEAGKIIGAAHAGWKGAKDGIIANAVEAMHDLGAKNIMAVIGPSIQQKSYEVGAEYYQSFIDDELSNTRFFVQAHNKDKYLFDLPGYVCHKLTESGVVHITRNMDDTYVDTKYYSFRRSCHQDDPYKGHLLSAIMIKPC